MANVATVVRGRPPVFTPSVKRHAAALARKYGATKAVEILGAPPYTSKGKLRNLNIVPKGISISLGTVTAAAKEYGVELKKGPRPTANV